jgi:virginiamycin B lyase
MRAGLVAALLALVPLPLALSSIAEPPASAATCSLVPSLNSVTINQGLGSYTPLVRGRTTLVRFYLSLPGCAGAGDAITTTGASLSVSQNGTQIAKLPSPVTQLTAPFPAITPAGSAPSLNAPSDPMFLLPGTLLQPTSTASFTISFSASISYTATPSGGTPTNGTVTFSTMPGTASPISATVAAQSHGLRVLLVPLGDAGQPYATQFTTAGAQATQNAMQTISRVWPLPDGVGDLTSTAKPVPGLRYTVDPTLINIGPLSGAKYCLTATEFNGLKGTLAQFLQSWNTANPNAPADVVAGLLDAAISNGSASGCAEGLGAVNAPEAVIRVVPDAPGAPSFSGGIAAMEVAHTQGLVPSGLTAEYNRYSAYHSKHVNADTTAPNRAYNVPTATFLADNHAVMDFAGDYNNNNVAMELGDWQYLLCKLGGPSTAQCATPGVIGNPAGGNPLFVIDGTTDGTAAGTQVVESYFQPGGLPTAVADPASTPYRLHLLGSSFPDTPVAVSAVLSEHGSTSPTSGPGVFSMAAPFDPAATGVQLLNGSTVLHTVTRNQIGSPPAITTNTIGQTSGPTITNYTDPSINGPEQITAGPDGALWFTNSTNNSIGRISTSGVVTNYPLPADGTQPYGITTGPDGALWFTKHAAGPVNGAIGRITTSGAVTIFTNGSISYPVGITTGPDGALWFTDAENGTFGRITTSGAVIEFANFNLGGLGDITTGPDGALWFDDAPNIGRLTTTGALTEFPIPGPGPPVGIVAGPDGALWFTGGNYIGRITTTGTVSAFPVVSLNQSLSGITTGPDGALWFANNGSNSVGRITTGGVVSDFTDPTILGPTGITTGADGALWFTNIVTNSIGRLSPGSQLVATVPPGVSPASLRLDVLLSCAAFESYPLAVGLAPTSVNGGTATFTYSLDTSLTCGNGTPTVTALVNDGFFQSSPTTSGATVTVSSPPKVPVAAIQDPPVGSTSANPVVSYLQDTTIPLVGSGLSAQNGTLGGSSLEWFLDGSTTPVATGSPAYMPAPPPGQHSVTLEVTDSTGATSATTRSFVVVADPNHEGIPAADAACGAYANPFALSGDGYSYLDTQAITGDACTPVTAYPATVTMTPTQPSVTPPHDTIPFGVLIMVPHRPPTAIALATISLHLGATDADGGPATCPALAIPASSYSANPALGKATFNRQPLDAYIRNRCPGLIGQDVPFTVTGGGTTNGQAWTFSGTGDFFPTTTTLDQ